jgi:hypothetical protein
MCQNPTKNANIALKLSISEHINILSSESLCHCSPFLLIEQLIMSSQQQKWANGKLLRKGV